MGRRSKLESDMQNMEKAIVLMRQKLENMEEGELISSLTLIESLARSIKSDYEFMLGMLSNMSS